MSAADAGRTAVYAAEDAAFGGTDAEDERSPEELALAARALTSGEWWCSAGAPCVRVGAARAGACSSSARSTGAPAGDVEVRVAHGQRTLATLGHELAHALAGVGCGHDATFRAAHVDVTALLLGRIPAARLGAAYEDLGVPAGRRRWPSPVRVTGDGFAVVP